MRGGGLLQLWAVKMPTSLTKRMPRSIGLKFDMVGIYLGIYQCRESLSIRYILT